MPIPARAYDRTLNAELERLLYQVQVLIQEADGLVAGLSEEQMRWSRPGEWSIAQHFEHLNLINAALDRSFRAAIERGRAEGLLNDGPYTYTAFGRWMIRFIGPPVKTRTRTKKEFAPGPEKAPHEILAAWRQGEAGFSELLNTANGLDLVKIKVPSPVTNLIKYNLGAAFWIRAVHDKRHLWLVRELRNGPGFPADQGAPKQ